MTGKLPVNHGGRRVAARLLEDQRVVVVVHVDLEPEALVALAVGSAGRETVRSQFCRPELVEVDLRGALCRSARGSPQYSHEYR